jgi:hypothetical protein
VRQTGSTRVGSSRFATGPVCTTPGWAPAHKSKRVIMLVHGLDLCVVSRKDGELLRHLTLDPSRDYQPQGP